MKPTNVTETPESRRLAENTRLQSQVKYHEDFERAKGKVTQVADDPETVRILNAHRIISNVAYHGDLERKKQMEEKRVLVPHEGGNVQSSDASSAKAAPQHQTVVHQQRPQQQQQQPATSQASMTAPAAAGAYLYGSFLVAYPIVRHRKREQVSRRSATGIVYAATTATTPGSYEQRVRAAQSGAFRKRR